MSYLLKQLYNYNKAKIVKNIIKVREILRLESFLIIKCT